MFVVLDINVCCAGYPCLFCWISMLFVLDIIQLLTYVEVDIERY